MEVYNIFNIESARSLPNPVKRSFCPRLESLSNLDCFAKSSGSSEACPRVNFKFFFFNLFDIG